MPFDLWSKTASLNASIDPTVNLAEGMAPSAVNDSCRAIMARLAEFRDDTSGLLTTAGTATAYTLATNQGLPTIPPDGQLIAFTPHATNGLAPTLTADGGTTYPIQTSPGVAVSFGSLVQGTPYSAKFSLSNLAWMLFGFYANPFVIPLASGMDYWGSAVPNSNFAFPAGQAISRTTYATLFALIGLTYGGGDGSTTFNLPDKRGRVTIAADNMGGTPANRVTAAGSGIDAANISASGGTETVTVVTPNLPAYTPSGAISQVTGTANMQGGNVGSSVANVAFYGQNTSAVNALGPLPLTLSAQSFTGNAQGGSSTPVRNMQPTLVGNYIMRIL